MTNKIIYTCPMHPEIISETPGKCPKCGGMELVPKEQIQPHKKIEDKGLGKLTIKNYIPLIVVVLMIFAASVVAAWNEINSLPFFIINFMTGFFLVFAGFKLMDLKGFAEGYSTYDLLASRVKAYGYAYPFIELAFGLLMLAGYHPAWLLWTEFIVMAFSGLGVVIKLSKGEEFQCACLGTFLKVPLTKITLMEDFGMAALALVLLFI
jgi:hypothetical protein